ncbi:MAG: AMP-binding protein [Neisseriaceae bacterium]|nr:MAG: AMP-binding protein [Neisseriaceae bacterium]
MERIWLKSYPKGVDSEVDVDSLGTIIDVFDRSVERFRHHKGFTSVNTVQTYGQTKEKVDLFSSFLQNELKIKKGDRIAVMLPNCLQYPIVVLGALQIGAVIVNVNPLYTAPELVHQLVDAEPTTIVIIENFAKTLEKALPEIPTLKNIILTSIGDQLHSFWGYLLNFVVRYIQKGVPSYKLPSNTIKFNDALKLGKKKSYIKVDIKNTDLAFLQYTGGTTGVAKGAMLTHRNICANMAQAQEWLKPYNFKLGGEIAMSPLPLYHIFSLTCNMMIFLNLGGQNILIANPMDTKMFIRQMRKYRISGLTAVNTLFNSLLSNPEFQKVDFSSWILCLGGGAAIQKDVADKWLKVTGLPIIEAYGLTEASPGVAVNPLMDTDDMKQKGWTGSVGLPLPGTDISLRDDNNNEVVLGESGELWIKGPQVMQGYWKQPEETAKVLKDGWLRTGDIATMDEDGYLRIVDRKKDLVVISGFNVYPNEVEDVVTLHPDIVECAVIGVPHPKTGEALKVFVVTSNPKLTGEEITKFCRQYLTGYKVPKIFEFRDQLPKSLVGKILRKELRDEELKRCNS